MKTGMAILRRNLSTSALVGILIGLSFMTNGFGASGSCGATPENRKLDYWLGTWEIGTPGSSGNAHSTVSLALDKCLVVENWDGGRGHFGQNIFGYSADDNSWHGLFADNEGRIHVFDSGRVSSGSAEFEGTSRGPNGEIVLNRIKVVELSSQRVEQIWEKSSDKGTTWNVVFRGEYWRTRPQQR